MTPPLFNWCRRVPKAGRAVIKIITPILTTMVAGLLGFAVIAIAYDRLADPLRLDVVEARQVNGDMEVLFTGEKYSGRCPGEWRLWLEQSDPFGKQNPIWTKGGQTGQIPVGKLSRYPVRIELPGWLEPGTYSVRFLLRYDCIWPFEHPVSFVLEIKDASEPASDDETGGSPGVRLD